MLDQLIDGLIHFLLFPVVSLVENLKQKKKKERASSCLTPDRSGCDETIGQTQDEAARRLELTSIITCGEYLTYRRRSPGAL